MYYIVLGGSTVDELSVALCCASIVAPVPEICLLKYTWCDYEKAAHNAPGIISINMMTV